MHVINEETEAQPGEGTQLGRGRARLPWQV